MRIETTRASAAVTLGILLLATAGCAGSSEAADAPSATPTRPPVQVGDCRTFVGADSVIVPCDQEHLEELFFAVSPEGDDRDLESLIRHAEEVCVGEAFTAFVGKPHSESALSVSTYAPEDDGLAAAPEGSVFCTVGTVEGGTVGTLKGAAH